MTTAIAEAPTSANTPPTETFARIPIDLVFRSPTNPRTHFDDNYIAELAESIREKGLIQPIVVRPMVHPTLRNQDAYEIVAGECRWRASHAAGLDAIPAMVRSYSDEQTLEVQLIENIHRTDLTPLEQAAGYRRLIDSNPTKHSAETIAARVGMSPAWVWDRLKLNDLIPEAKQLLETERISVGHAIVIARLKPADQARVIKVGRTSGYGSDRSSGLWEGESDTLQFDDDPKAAKKDPYAHLKPKTIREMEAWIADHIRFDVEHAAKAAPLQFEPVAEQVQAAAAQPGRGRKVISITFDHSAQTEAAKADGERTYGLTSWRRADGQGGKPCEHAVLGVVVAGGRGYGQTFQVCIARDKCEVHWAKEIRERQKNQKLRDSGQGAKAAKNEKRAEDSWQVQQRKREEERKAWERELDTQLLPALVAHLKGQKLTTELVVRLISEWDRKRILKLLGGAITDVNVGQAAALAIVFDGGDYNREVFAKSVKPFGFKVPAKPKAETKTTTKAAAKKGGKKR